MNSYLIIKVEGKIIEKNNINPTRIMEINHDAVYDKKWFVDKAAWDETVTTGYRCSSCGETK